MRLLMPKRCAQVVLVILWATSMVAAPVASAGENANSRVFPVNARPFGLSYSQWLARFGQWSFNLPADAHPLFDTADCSAGQSGKVWFLDGTFNFESTPEAILAKADRHCRIPSGTALFVNIISAIATSIQGDGRTPEELHAVANFIADFIVPESLSLEIDGQSVTNLEDFRVESPAFTIGPLPKNNVFGEPSFEGQTSLVVLDGYAVMLKPLSVGTHTIRFFALADATPIGGPIVIYDISYTITVVPRGQYDR
jgi:hypothetical protein